MKKGKRAERNARRGKNDSIGVLPVVFILQISEVHISSMTASLGDAGILRYKNCVGVTVKFNFKSAEVIDEHMGSPMAVSG